MLHPTTPNNNIVNVVSDGKNVQQAENNDVNITANGGTENTQKSADDSSDDTENAQKFADDSSGGSADTAAPAPQEGENSGSDSNGEPTPTPTPTPAVAFDETSVSDPSTVDTWNQVVKDSTENIGRIWTDKTVLTEDIQLEGGSRPSVKKGDSDFLVGLSALSSTSNTVKTVSRPLDIVLVVDTSGSMENSPHMGTRPESERYRYEEIYAGNH